jgi:hypothetical protein
MAVEISLDRRDFLANAVMAVGGVWLGIAGDSATSLNDRR